LNNVLSTLSNAGSWPLTAPPSSPEIIPLMRPQLPTAEELLPYLQRIDERRIYSNFGPLQEEFLQRLLAFQEELEQHVVHGVLTCNATQALELTLAALGLPTGSRVAVPALTFPATATAVQRCGLVPVAFDVDALSWLLTPACLPDDTAIAGIAAVLPVSTFGMPQDAKAWSNWSQRHRIPVVIDAAAAFGAQQTAPQVTAVFSLHATKTLSSGEGGLIITRDCALASRLRSMSNFGIAAPAPSVATNAKMSEYHAAVGLAHLKLWPTHVQARRQVLRAYHHALAPFIGQILDLQENTGLYAPSVFTVRLRSAELRVALETACQRDGIQTRRWYQPLVHQTPTLSGIESGAAMPVAQGLARRLIGMPFFIDLTPVQVIRVKNILLTLADSDAQLVD
jgi:dTDP-4-amino-4,6-dideoxygalactose transaminase